MSLTGRPLISRILMLLAVLFFVGFTVVGFGGNVLISAEVLLGLGLTSEAASFLIA